MHGGPDFFHGAGSNRTGPFGPFRKNFFDESERYRMSAIEYLNKRNRAIDGPRTPTIQMNADVTTVPWDVMID